MSELKPGEELTAEHLRDDIMDVHSKWLETLQSRIEALEKALSTSKQKLTSEPARNAMQHITSIKFSNCSDTTIKGVRAIEGHVYYGISYDDRNPEEGFVKGSLADFVGITLGRETEDNSHSEPMKLIGVDLRSIRSALSYVYALKSIIWRDELLICLLVKWENTPVHVWVDKHTWKIRYAKRCDTPRNRESIKDLIDLKEFLAPF